MSSDRDKSRPGDVIGTVGTSSGMYPLLADGTISEEGEEHEWPERVVAVIYDRLATPSRAYLEMRLEACREYAAERGWTIAAEHVDTGDAALHDRVRPAMSAALVDVRTAGNARGTDRVVLLVYNEGRLPMTR